MPGTAGGRSAFGSDKPKEIVMRKIALPAAVLTLGLAACGSPESEAPEAEATTAAEPREAVALLRTAEGEPAGSATATALGDTVSISLTALGLPPGEHGVHVHMTGACEAPAFESAGAHWNPTDQTHGLEDPPGQHAGDMPNLTVDEDGTGTLDYQLVGSTFDGLLDADGSALVVHAMPDDQMTDPSGNSGDRVACGILTES
jgi:Cu-Zn family superoxide dismutase